MRTKEKTMTMLKPMNSVRQDEFYKRPFMRFATAIISLLCVAVAMAEDGTLYLSGRKLFAIK